MLLLIFASILEKVSQKWVFNLWHLSIRSTIYWIGSSVVKNTTRIRCHCNLSAPMHLVLSQYTPVLPPETRLRNEKCCHGNPLQCNHNNSELRIKVGVSPLSCMNLTAQQWLVRLTLLSLNFSRIVFYSSNLNLFCTNDMSYGDTSKKFLID